MSDPLASVSDLEIRMKVEVGSLQGVDLSAAQTAIEDATTLVLAAGDPAWTPDTVPSSVKKVVIGCALRNYNNPNGYTSENYGGAYVYTVEEASGYLTADELAIIEKAVSDGKPGGSSGFVGSVRTRSAYAGSGGVPQSAPWWW